MYLLLPLSLYVQVNMYACLFMCMSMLVEVRKQLWVSSFKCLPLFYF